MSDQDQVVGSIGLTEQWIETSTGKHARLVAAALVGQTTGNDEVLVTATTGGNVHMELQASTESIGILGASTAVIGHIIADASTAKIGALQPSTETIGFVDVPRSVSALYNVTLTAANTEYSQALPSNCRSFEWQCRTPSDVRYAYSSGYVAGSTAPYKTLKANSYYYSDFIKLTTAPITLYIATAATSGPVVEIEAWTAT